VGFARIFFADYKKNRSICENLLNPRHLRSKNTDFFADYKKIREKLLNLHHPRSKKHEF